MKKIPLGLTIVAAATGLTACGSTSDSQKIKDVLNEVGTSTDKSVCTKDFTPAGRQTFETATGQTCVMGIAQNGKTSSKPNVTKVSVSGSTATATLKGSSGRTADVTLVKQGGSWKISGLKNGG
jgi:hypothetical protein